MPSYRSRIRDGREQFGEFDEYVARVLALFASKHHRPDGERHALPPQTEVDAGEPLTAFVNSDRWVARCANPNGRGGECGDVQFVWLDRPLFMCATCMNAEQGYRWRWIELPTVKTRGAVEAVLGHRKLVGDRNWDPATESIAELRRQNREAGESVPEGDD